MPQMSPMNWVGLMLYFYFFLFLAFLKIHFLYKVKSVGSASKFTSLSTKMVMLI